MTRRRDFGSVRRLPSGRWQARYSDPRGGVHADTFRTRGAASRWLAGVRADLDRGAWFDPDAGRSTLADYFESWITARRVRGRPLAPQTIDLYRRLFARHIAPELGLVELRRLDLSLVRTWHGHLTAADGPGDVTAAKSYRLLHVICATAVADEQIARTPCRLAGGGQEASPERRPVTVAEVYALAEAVGERWRALVLLAAFGALRFGELAALTRQSVDPMHGIVSVVASVAELPGGRLQVGPPKSRAGARVVRIPAAIVPELESHLANYAAQGPEGRVFVGPNGGPLTRANFGRSVWRPATVKVGVPGLHFHDLRHVGATLAAATGASTAELMARLGHASADAALRYQHATADRDAAIAAALSDLVTGVAPAPRPAAAALLRPRATSL